MKVYKKCLFWLRHFDMFVFGKFPNQLKFNLQTPWPTLKKFYIAAKIIKLKIQEE